jgi:hypothetical protein
MRDNLYELNLSSYVGILIIYYKLKNITDNKKHQEMLHK